MSALDERFMTAVCALGHHAHCCGWDYLGATQTDPGPGPRLKCECECHQEGGE